MIGKAFYYQQSYTRAIRKFLELLSIEDTGLHLEAQLWLGKSKLQMREFEEGLSILDEVKEIALNKDEDEIYNEASISQIAYLIYKEEYPQAIETCNEFVKVSKDDEIIAETFFKVGELYNIIGDYESAYNSFLQVNEYSPSYELEFFSLLEASKVLYEMERNEESLELLGDMFNEDKFAEHLDFIQLEMGMNYYNLDRIDEAKDVFVLIDSTYTKSEAAGVADYQLGKLWEYKLFDYDSAKQYYKLASITPAPQEYKDSAIAKNEIFDKYFFLMKEYQNNITKLYYLENPEAYVQDSIAYAEYEERLNDFLEQKRLEEEAENPASQNPQEMLSQQSNSGQTNTDTRGVDSNSPSGTNTNQNNVTARRGNTSRISNTSTRGGTGRNMLDKIKTEDLPDELRIAVTEPLRPNMTADSLSSIIATKMFNLGNLFFTDFNVPDSSEFYYKKILATRDSSTLTPNTIFALGSLYQTKGDTVEADNLFREIVDNYPNSEVYVEAAKKLGEWEEIIQDDDPSEELFIKAERYYYSSNIDSAFIEWNSIVEKNPESKFAPKSLYTMGYLLENELMLLDSAAAVYNSLMKNYASSIYSAQIGSKLRNYEDEYGSFDMDTIQVSIQDTTNISVQDSSNIQIGAEKVIADSSEIKMGPEPVIKEEKIIEKERKGLEIKKEGKRDSGQLPKTRIIDSEILEKAAKEINDSIKVSSDSLNIRPGDKTLKKVEDKEALLQKREEAMNRNAEIVEMIKKQKLQEKNILEKESNEKKDSSKAVVDSLKNKVELKTGKSKTVEIPDSVKVHK